MTGIRPTSGARRLGAVALLVAGLAGAAALAWHGGIATPGEAGQTDDPMISAILASHRRGGAGPNFGLPESVPTGLTASTDRGNLIELRMMPLDRVPAKMVREVEAWLVREGAGDKVLGPPDTSYNCHGLVVAGSRFWVEGPDFELVLRDNGYRLVRVPESGDVAVYRGAGEEIVHSGLVRQVSGDEVLVESKWGVLHRVLHAVAGQPFSQRWGYYRTNRGGHQMRQGGTHDSARPAPGRVNIGD